MAENTAVNSQITDSVTQVNTKVLGDAPAIAMGNLFQATSQALSLAALNATSAQQQSNMTAQATTTMGTTTLYSIDTATDAVGTSDILDQLNKK
jgi:predicted lipoprotein with Yx(FWY)xxD motif